MKTIKYIFLFLPVILSAQAYVGIGAGNIDFEPDNISFSANVTYQPTMFGVRVQYFNTQAEDSWQLQTTIEPFRGDIWTPVISGGYNFQNSVTQPMLGLQNQFEVAPNAYITTGYEVIFENGNTVQYIYFGTTMRIVEPESKPKRFY